MTLCTFPQANVAGEKIALICDTCSDIPLNLAADQHIYLIPVMIHCSKGELRDQFDISTEEVYALLKTELPKTSLPTGEDIEAVFNQVKADGYTHAIVITVASSLSGTYNRLRLAAQERTDLQISVVDSMNGSVCEYALAMQATAAINEGLTFAQILAKLNYSIAHTQIYAAVDTLEYLQKGGRISKLAATAGSILNIKPLLTFDDTTNELTAVAKLRGNKQVVSKSIALLKERCAKDLAENKPYVLLFVHSNASERIAEAEAQLLAEFPAPQAIYRCNISAALAVHLGEGLLYMGLQFLES